MVLRLLLFFFPASQDREQERTSAYDAFFAQQFEQLTADTESAKHGYALVETTSVKELPVKELEQAAVTPGKQPKIFTLEEGYVIGVHVGEDIVLQRFSELAPDGAIGDPVILQTGTELYNVGRYIISIHYDEGDQQVIEVRDAETLSLLTAFFGVNEMAEAAAVSGNEDAVYIATQLASGDVSIAQYAWEGSLIAEQLVEGVGDIIEIAASSNSATLSLLMISQYEDDLRFTRINDEAVIRVATNINTSEDRDVRVSDVFLQGGYIHVLLFDAVAMDYYFASLTQDLTTISIATLPANVTEDWQNPQIISVADDISSAMFLAGVATTRIEGATEITEHNVEAITIGLD